MRRLAWVILAALCFGAGLTVSRLGLKEFSPLDYTALRLLAALLAFTVFYAAFRRRPPPFDRKLWMFGLALGVVGTALPMLGIITALQHLSSGIAAVVATSGPAFAVLFAHVILPDERITTRRATGVALALAGAILLVLQGETGLRGHATDVAGYVFLIGALALSHGSLVLSRRLLKKQDVLDVVCVQMVGATLFLTPLALRPGDLARVGDVGMAWFTVLFGGLIGTFLAFNARFKLVKEFGATDAALVDYVVPIVSTLTGTLFAGEHITAPIVICMGVILLGVHLVHPERLARRPAHQPIPTVPSIPKLKRAEE